MIKMSSLVHNLTPKSPVGDGWNLTKRAYCIQACPRTLIHYIGFSSSHPKEPLAMLHDLL